MKKGNITKEESHEEETVRLDPHVWLSPVLAQEEVQTIAAALAEQDPKNKDYYESNSETYIGQLKELDDTIPHYIDGCREQGIHYAACGIWIFSEGVWVDTAFHCRNLAI